MTSEGSGGSGTRFIAHRYPVEEGLTAGTTKQVGARFLVAEEKSLIRQTDKTLLY